MKLHAYWPLAALLTPALALAGMNDDPVLTKLDVKQLEGAYRDGDTRLAWNIEGWLGTDLHKLVLTSEGARLDGRSEEQELRLFYRRAIAPYWDLQLGWHHAPLAERRDDRALLGINGTAPGYLETEFNLLMGPGTDLSAELSVEREIRLTRQWVLSPEVGLTAHNFSDPEEHQGSGLADLDLELRLAWEVRPDLAPYVGVTWERKLGDSADLARASGHDVEETYWRLGVSFWF
ncbi:copper resistance protein B [Marinobacterium weihaiense]|uniref:Copper resistance protein B n=1 Tax=Marinobacterium weihaiense TaxID=2851016 RepID=A0ABS6MA59_9GAMM|nr:copper resistance protein B [Marinobacterium weihaiense]MBV0933115.1 copper resistance protein B [Marinobacterium weihaiense]